MNIKVSSCINRKKGASKVEVSAEGKSLKSQVVRVGSNESPKDVILSMLTKGLRLCRGIVKHEDILYIEVQNRHLCDWLTGAREHIGFSDGMDGLFEVLESLDCRYRFVFVEKPSCRVYEGEGLFGKVEGSSVESAFEGME